jgi:starch-binding outer membrane protein, SusD/RagB family
MMILSHRTRWMIAACTAAVGSIGLTACNHVKNELLAPQNPGLISPSAVASPSAAQALYVGALGRLKNVILGSEQLWQESGNLTDEYKNSDFQVSRQSIDQRQITPDNGDYPYNAVTQPRGFIRTAISAMQTYLPTQTGSIGELYMALGFIEMSLAEDYCNGIPLGSTTNGVVTYGPPLTNVQVYDSASAHLDTAIAMSTATDAGTVFVHQAALITKARILVDLGQFAAAAALTPAVPTSYQYVFTFSTASGDNGIWSLMSSQARISVADSFDLIGGSVNVIQNALPFASANDPRVKVLPGTQTTPHIGAEDGTTPMFIELMYNRDDPIPMVSGVDARLIEAEAALNANNIAGMMTILNTLRAAAPKLGIFQVPAMPPIATTPTTQADATTLFFREKAFWTYGRGQRLGDLRRLIRQYGRTQDKVFPNGTYFKGGTYGSDVNFPVSSSELVNPLFHGCLDRNA